MLYLIVLALAALAHAAPSPDADAVLYSTPTDITNTLVDTPEAAHAKATTINSPDSVSVPAPAAPIDASLELEPKVAPAPPATVIDAPASVSDDPVRAVDSDSSFDPAVVPALGKPDISVVLAPPALTPEAFPVPSSRFVESAGAVALAPPVSTPAAFNVHGPTYIEPARAVALAPTVFIEPAHAIAAPAFLNRYSIPAITSERYLTEIPGVAYQNYLHLLEHTRASYAALNAHLEKSFGLF